MTATSSAQRRSAALSRGADPLAAVRDRVLARDAAALRPVPELSAAGEPDRHHRAVRALARPDPRLCRHRLARPCRLLRPRRLHRRPDRQVGLGRAADRAADRGAAAAGLLGYRHELHHRPLPASRADHDHARPRLPAARGRQQRELADRRHRRPAGRAHLAAVRHLRVRSLRLHRLRLFAGRAVPGLPGGAAARQLAVRPGAARHPRERGAHAGDRRAEPRAYPQDLHHLRRHRRHRRRAARADHRDRLARDA